MRSSLYRLRVVALVAFFPLAVVGLMRERTSLRSALRLYYASILTLGIFLIFLAIYTYTQGGNFIPPLATFY